MIINNYIYNYFYNFYIYNYFYNHNFNDFSIKLKVRLTSKFFIVLFGRTFKMIE